MTQELTQNNSDQRIVMASLVKPNDAPMRLTVVAPFGLSLPDGVTLSVGDETLTKMTFQTCERVGCFARGSLDEDTLAWLRAGNAMLLTTKTADGRTLRFEMSLSGFTQAEERLIALSQPASVAE